LGLGNRDVQERRGRARARARDAGGPHHRRDRLPVPGADPAPRAAQRTGLHRSRARQACRDSRLDEGRGAGQDRGRVLRALRPDPAPSRERARMKLEVTILGCGSSGGVPRADGAWGVCDPHEPKNRRSRCSMMIRRPSGEGPDRWTTAVVDASPEFRLQTAEAGAKRLDALLLTHDHADQSHGIDDIRAFAIRQRARIPCWVDPPTSETMETRFGYIFHGEKGYPAIADLVAVPPHGEP